MPIYELLVGCCMNSSKNIIAVTGLSVILIASLVWLGRSNRQAWIFSASASEDSTSDSIVLLPESMTASEPVDREKLIRLADQPVENHGKPSWLITIRNAVEELLPDRLGDLPIGALVEYGSAFDNGTKALLHIRLHPPSGRRISACLEFAITKTGWQLSGVRYRRQRDNQRIAIASTN